MKKYIDVVKRRKWRCDSIKNDWQEQQPNKKGENKKWSDEVQELIERLEERTCLWNIYDKEYTKRELKVKPYSELAEHFDTNWTTTNNKAIKYIFSNICMLEELPMLTQTYPICWTNIAENVGWCWTNMLDTFSWALILNDNRRFKKNIADVMVTIGCSNVKRREFSILKYKILEMSVKWYVECENGF